MTIGKRIAAARTARGWSQSELASRAKVKQPTLNRIELGGSDKHEFAIVQKIAHALGVTMDSLAVPIVDAEQFTPPDRLEALSEAVDALRLQLVAIGDAAEAALALAQSHEQRLSRLDSDEEAS